MGTLTSEPYRTYKPEPFTRAERDSVTILFGGLHWRVERILQAVLESGGNKARGTAGGHQGRPPHRPRDRRHRPVLPHQLHDGQPGQLPQEEVGGDRRGGGEQEVRLPHRRLLRRLPIRPVPPELRARPAQLGARGLPYVPPRPGPARPEGRHGRRPRHEPAGDAGLPLGHLHAPTSCRTSSIRCGPTRWCRADRRGREGVASSYLYQVFRNRPQMGPYEVGGVAPGHAGAS